MNAIKKSIAALLFATLTTPALAAVTDNQVFAYAEGNYASLFSGASQSGQFQQYNYRYYPATKNYLAVDSAKVIHILGPVSNNAIQSVGPVSAFEGLIAAWEAKQGTATGGTTGAARQLTGVVTTLAGYSPANSLGSNYGIADGTGAAAQFDLPHGITVDSAGNLYVADRNNQTIRKITPAGVVSTLAGGVRVSGSADGTGTAARFYNPEGIAVDSAGNLYVVDWGNSTIRKITPAGVVSTFAGNPYATGSEDGTGTAARFLWPSAITIDSAGNLYVSDSGNYTIRKITPAGVVSTIAGRARVSGSADGTGSAAQFSGPKGITTDGSGNLYVADTINHTIRKITPAGVVTTLAGSAGAQGSADGTGAAARFYNPHGITVDSAGNLYVADYGNSTIRKITPVGVVSTLAGSAGWGFGSADGTGTAAKFYGPYGITIDSAGNLYVTDSLNATIRKIQ